MQFGSADDVKRDAAAFKNFPCQRNRWVFFRADA